MSTNEKLDILKEKFPELRLDPVVGESRSVTKKFWTICQHSFTPVDPSEAFEKKSKLTEVPWVEREYYSYESILSTDLIQQLSEIDKQRFKALARTR